MATKFRQKSAKIAQISILCKNEGIFPMYGKLVRYSELVNSLLYMLARITNQPTLTSQL